MNTLKTVILTLALTTLCYSETWIHYNLDNSNIAGNYAQCMTIDPFNNIYVGCDWRGISKFNGHGWVSWTPDNSSYPQNAIEPVDLGSDSDGHLWITSDTRNLIEFDGIDFTIHETENHARWLTVDSEDNIWYEGWHRIVTKYDGATFVDYNSSDFGDQSILAAPTTGPNGSVWFVSDSSLIEFDGDSWIVSDNYGYVGWQQSIAFDSSGNVWTGFHQNQGNQNGVAKYDGENWTTYTFHSDSLSFYFPCALQFDSGGDLWVGYNYGLARFDGHNWTQYLTTDTGQELGWITSVVIDADNNKWLGSFGNGVFVFNEDGVIMDTHESKEIPSTFKIISIYPNPMNPDVIIQYSLNIETDLAIGIFDITGRQVWTRRIPTNIYGEYNVRWNGVDLQSREVTSGIYFVRLTANASSETRRLLVLR